MIDAVLTGDFRRDLQSVRALVADVKGFAHRAPGEPINETVGMGPHEGFNESLRDNIVLIRRVMQSPALISESMTVGRLIPTRLCLLYLDGVARRENLDALRNRIAGCNVDYVSSLGMLEQLIEDQPLSLLAQTVQTERPDRAVSFLNEGQILVAMDNAPAVLAMPAAFLHLFHALDDTALRWPYGTFLRVLRLLGCLLLTGCANRQFEEELLAIVVAVDQQQGSVRLAIKAPAVHAGAGDQEDYLQLEAGGASFAQAVTVLNASTPPRTPPARHSKKAPASFLRHRAPRPLSFPRMLTRQSASITPVISAENSQ